VLIWSVKECRHLGDCFYWRVDVRFQ